MKKTFVSAGALSKLVERVPRQILIATIAGMTLLIGGGIVVNFLYSTKSGSTSEVVASAYQELARGLASEIAVALDPYELALDEIAANADVRAALSAGDADALSSFGRQLAPPLDGVLKLRILLPSWRDPEPGAVPPLTFASISMIKKARDTGHDVPTEVHLAGTDNEHVVFLKRIEALQETADDFEFDGFLHLSVDPDVVRRTLTANPPAGVFVEIRQGPGVVIASSGIQPESDSPSTSTNVKGTRVAVILKATGLVESGSASESAGGSILMGFALFGACAAGLWIYLSRRGTSVTVGSLPSDSVIFQGAIKAILDGAHPGLEQFLPGAAGSGASLDFEALAERAALEDATEFKSAGVPDEDPTVPRTGDDVPPRDDVKAAAETPHETKDAADIPSSIFRAYDIRGIVDETLTEEGVYFIGRALGAEADVRGQKTIVVARDGRHSSELLKDALTKGLLESGRDVLDIGLTPTPVLYFATHYLDAHSGVMITGSHNPSQYNGLKIVLDGETLAGDAIQAIRRRIEAQEFVDGTGSMQSAEIVPDYIRRISEEIPVTLGNALKVVVDCGNSVPGIVAPAILRAIGHDVIELFCEVDGDFPNHHPDPSQPENLRSLIDAVADESADLGLAFDGDGDRLGVIDGEGNIIWPDRQMILFARDILSRNTGAKIIFDVKCSRLLATEITARGGEPIMSKTGHSLIKAKMAETGALLAGEMSGHIFFKERWYGFDDALYAAARLLEILVNSSESPAEVFAGLPSGVATPELRLVMPEEHHAEFMQKVLASGASFDDAEISTVDGLRADFSDSWGLIRASNTTPCLILRFEGDDEAALENVKKRFRDLLTGIDAGLSLAF